MPQKTAAHAAASPVTATTTALNVLGADAAGEAGLTYTWAVTTIDAVNMPATDPFLLRRIPGVVETHWLIQAAELAGLLAIGTRLKRIYGKFFRK